MMSDLTWASPRAFGLLLMLPGLYFWITRQERARASFRFPLASSFPLTPSTLRLTLLKRLPWVRMLALTAVITALARPQISDGKMRDLSVEGIDIVIALDLSTSMEAGDFRPSNRLQIAKEVLTDVVSTRVNDRIGLVVFAGMAYTQVPLTLDYGVLKEMLKQLRTRVLEDGTAIGDALAVSLNRLRESDAKSRVVVVITDGDNNAGKISPLDAATMAHALKIPVFTILVGKGGRVPFPAGQDFMGNTVWREMDIPVNPELLQQISSATGGEFYQATNRDELKRGLQNVLDKMERSKLIEGGAVANLSEIFQPFLAFGFFLLIAEWVLRLTWLRVFP